MNDTDYRQLLHLLNTTLELFERGGPDSPALHRQLRTLAVEVALLRARIGQPAPELQRN